jgi:hypothetical protein
MVVFRAAVASLFLLVGACGVGEVPIGGGGTTDGGAGGGTGAATFTSQVKPLLTRCDGCHSAGTPPNFTSFATLTDRYKTKPSTANVLITKAADGATHQGVAYLNATEKQAVAMWIDGL